VDILTVDEVHKDFKGLKVLNGVHFSVRQGERHAVIGPNGAGKTTLFNIISGKFTATSGRIAYQGSDISRMPAYARNRLGISRSFQITNVFQDLTVFENVMTGVRCHYGLRYHMFKCPDKDPKIQAKTAAILDQIGLHQVKDFPARELSYGQQRSLEIGITLSTDPDLILLDEPTAGMTREETAETIGLIDRLTRDRSLLIIEHDMEVVFSLAQTVSVLHYGDILASGPPEEIRRDQRVKDAYLGDEQ
jgi:branched-chain amino acid transport system ATP-binding protein